MSNRTWVIVASLHQYQLTVIGPRWKLLYSEREDNILRQNQCNLNSASASFPWFGARSACTLLSPWFILICCQLISIVEFKDFNFLAISQHCRFCKTWQMADSDCSTSLVQFCWRNPQTNERHITGGWYPCKLATVIFEKLGKWQIPIVQLS